MTFSKLSFITAICLGISGLVSCSGIQSPTAESEVTSPGHISSPEECCISIGVPCEEQNSAGIPIPSRERMHDEARQESPGCIHPSVVDDEA